jgi:hypothetical protein
MSVVGGLIAELNAGTTVDPATALQLFEEECDANFEDEEDVKLCYSEVAKIGEVTEETLDSWLNHYSARDICAGVAEDPMVNFCKHGDSHVVTPL